MSLSRVVPPLTRKWHDVLPPPFHIGQPIIAVTIPIDWHLNEGCTIDKAHRLLAAVSPDESEVLGLQLIDPEIPKYLDQRDLFRHYQIKMADPVWIGPLTNLPQYLLLDEESTVLLFVRDEMWRRPLDLKRVWKPPPQEKKC